MAEMVGTVHTHTHTPCNLIDKNTNTQYICVFNNSININCRGKKVGTRPTLTCLSAMSNKR